MKTVLSGSKACVFFPRSSAVFLGGKTQLRTSLREAPAGPPNKGTAGPVGTLGRKGNSAAKRSDEKVRHGDSPSHCLLDLSQHAPHVAMTTYLVDLRPSQSPSPGGSGHLGQSQATGRRKSPRTWRAGVSQELSLYLDQP